MDGDGDPDIVSALAGVFWLENQLPSLAWTPHTVISATSSEYFIGTCADLNGDNKPDVVAGPSPSHGSVSFFANPGWGETTMHPDPLFYYTGPAGDVDSDGDTDFLYGGNGYSPQPLGWLENKNNGANWVVHDVTQALILQQIPTGIADIHGDGDKDIVSLSFDVNTGLGSALRFANPKISTGTSGPASQTIPFTVLPNPAGDYADIDIQDGQAGVFQVQLFDLTGRLLYGGEAAGGGEKTRLDLRDITPGTYLLKVCTGTGGGVRRVVRQ